MNSTFYIPKPEPRFKAIGASFQQGFGCSLGTTRSSKLASGTMMTYGVKYGSGDLIKKCIRKNHDFLYMDHTFFAQKRVSIGYFTKAIFRLIKNGRYWHGIEDMPSDRFEKLDIKLKPWKKTGSKIIVIPISVPVGEVMGINPDDWLESTLEALNKHTDREIIVKEKKRKVDGVMVRFPPLSDYLDDTHAVVAMHSNATVEAVTHGVPIFCGKENAAHSIAEPDLTKIESPIYPDREQVLWNLAYQQFTLDEIKLGLAKEILYGI
jgi:hypothetical protein